MELFSQLIWIQCLILVICEVHGKSIPMKKMTRKRCGNNDEHTIIHNSRHGRSLGMLHVKDNHWTKRTITFEVLNGPKTVSLWVGGHRTISRARVAELARQAFEEWAPHCGLNFQPWDGEGLRADIMISFRRRDHGDEDPFDGPGLVLAHADYPKEDGVDIHFDDDEIWVDKQTSSDEEVDNIVSFYPILLHEIGHALGLKHSFDWDSIMYGAENSHIQHLTKGDIDRMQDLYGISEDSFSTTSTEQKLPTSTASEELPTSSSEELPTSTSSEELPTSTSSEELPTSTSSEELPTSKSSEELPTSTSSEELPTSTSSEELPTSTSSEELPTSTSSEELPNSTSSEELPTSTSSEELPTFTSSEELPTSTSSEELPTSTSFEELPTSTSSEELPTSTSSEELATSTSSEELPTSTTSEEEPTLTLSNELNTSTTSEELPTSTSSEELPTLTLSNELNTSTTSEELPTSTSYKKLPTSTSYKELPTSTTYKELPTSTTSEELPTSPIIQSVKIPDYVTTSPIDLQIPPKDLNEFSAFVDFVKKANLEFSQPLAPMYLYLKREQPDLLKYLYYVFT